MKKILLSVFTFMIAFIHITTIVNASSNQNIGVIIIGDDEFKQEVYFNRSAKIFDVKKNPNLSVKYGETVQKNYSDYCKEKSISDSAPPKLENLLEFSNQNNFDRVMCLVVKTPEVSDYYEYKDGLLPGSPSRLSKHFTVTITVNAYLCDKEKILKTISITKTKTENDIYSSKPKVRATRGAFTSCVENIGKEIKGI